MRAQIYTDSMVLQAERPVVVGWTNASSVQVTIVDGTRLVTCPSTIDQTSQMFTAECGSQPASVPTAPGATITIRDSDGGSANLTDVLFGSVFVLSGQSNAAFAITTAFNGQDFIARANDPGMRVMTVQKVRATAPRSTSEP
jgi:sialate O-acetylesterase